MILTMAYLLLIAILVGLAALIGERLCAELGWPRRGAWLLALVTSIVLPGYAIFFGATTTTGTPIISLPLLPDALLAIDSVETVGTAAATTTPFSWPDWRAFERALVGLWVVSSAAMLLFYSVAHLRLHRVLRQTQRVSLDSQEVLLSDSLGPAVLGFLRPRIVLPRWIAEQDAALRSYALCHEREHIAARDHVALFVALIIVALMPWNVALWWQLRRLRAAIEVDCDRRVLRDGVDAHAYSEALLTISQRSTGTPFASVALTEPVSELENRIRMMLARAREFSIARFGARAALVVAVLGLAIVVNAPSAQQTAGAAGTANAATLPTIRTIIYDRLAEAQACMENEDTACALQILDAVSARPDLNAYETAQVENFYAFVHFDRDEVDEAARAYERILALPRSDIPDGLIQSTMRNLATLYLSFERFEDGLDLYDRWMALPSVTAGPDDYYLRATILYQLERYQDALAPLEQAIADAAEPVERYYQLLYVLQWEAGDDEGVVETLETLNQRWPKEQWARALAGATEAQAAVTTAATTVGPPAFAIQDGEYVPIVRVAPFYPPQAARRGLEGYVVVGYTVTRTGETDDIEVVESSDSVFEDAAIEAAARFKYRPRIVDGMPVEVAGVTSRIKFELDEDAE